MLTRPAAQLPVGRFLLAGRGGVLVGFLALQRPAALDLRRAPAPRARNASVTVTSGAGTPRRLNSRGSVCRSSRSVTPTTSITRQSSLLGKVRSPRPIAWEYFTCERVGVAMITASTEGTSTPSHNTATLATTRRLSGVQPREDRRAAAPTGFSRREPRRVIPASRNTVAIRCASGTVGSEYDRLAPGGVLPVGGQHVEGRRGLLERPSERVGVEVPAGLLDLHRA